MNTLLKYSLIASFLVGGLVGNVWAQTTPSKEAPAKTTQTADGAALPAKENNEDALAGGLAVKVSVAELAAGLTDDVAEVSADLQTTLKSTLEALAPAAPATEELLTATGTGAPATGTAQ